MNEGRTFPVAGFPADRFALLRHAQERHGNAVEDYERAAQAFWDDVNKLALPELMQGPVVRVTDADTIQKARTVLELTETGEAETDRLISELADYRAERDRLAEYHGIADLAEVVAVTAAAVVRAGRG